MTFEITPASPNDLDEALSFIQEIIGAGETYALSGDMVRQDIHDYFFHKGHKVFKATLDGEIVGICYLRANQSGGGSHVANAGFMVSSLVRRKGIARRMARHILDVAKESGFMAMQFNFVVSTNMAAVTLWKDLGFDIVGTLPKAFNHPAQGKVDALVMYKFL
ncbi:MAG: N-acetyltransferase family protein [Bdellovibrionales bacterium]